MTEYDDLTRFENLCNFLRRQASPEVETDVWKQLREPRSVESIVLQTFVRMAAERDKQDPLDVLPNWLREPVVRGDVPILNASVETKPIANWADRTINEKIHDCGHGPPKT